MRHRGYSPLGWPWSASAWWLQAPRIAYVAVGDDWLVLADAAGHQGGGEVGGRPEAVGLLSAGPKGRCIAVS